MRLDDLLTRIRDSAEADVLVHRGSTHTYRELERERLAWIERLPGKGVTLGQVIGIQADYSLPSVSLLLALLANLNIVALIAPDTKDLTGLIEDGRMEGVFVLRNDQEPEFSSFGKPATSHPLLDTLRTEGKAGLIIFSSGTTGRPKAVLHDLDRFLLKFADAKKRFRTLTFLLFDHIAGLDTLFYILASGGTVVIPEGRDVRTICRLIETFRVEVLPTSPTFLNLLCLSREFENHDLSSLRILTYGSEPMNPHTLKQLEEAFPKLSIIQKYGTSEFGSPRSISRPGDSLWIQFDSTSVKTKVVDSILWVQSPSTMLGYLNSDEAVVVDGWFCTGDEVEVDGEWLRILGRRSELINVGGEKVYPAEVEAVIEQMEEVVEVLVYGESSPLIGNIVCCKVRLDRSWEDQLDEKGLTRLVRKFCLARLDRHKVPVKAIPVKESLSGARQKKLRDQGGG